MSAVEQDIPTYADWNTCEITGCNDGTYRASVRRRKALVVQYGRDADNAFDKLTDLVRGLDKNAAARTTLANTSDSINLWVK